MNGFIKLRESIERSENENQFESAIEDENTRALFWDFESYLTAVNCSLDALARVVGTAYKEQTPPSFNKLCGKTHLGGCAEIFRTAKRKWVQRLKNYRDCFIHYTPIDTMSMMQMRLYPEGWQTFRRLPINPNSREILRFGFRGARSCCGMQFPSGGICRRLTVRLPTRFPRDTRLALIPSGSTICFVGARQS